MNVLPIMAVWQNIEKKLLQISFKCRFHDFDKEDCMLALVSPFSISEKNNDDAK